jgi:hypothetical protein
MRFWRNGEAFHTWAPDDVGSELEPVIDYAKQVAVDEGLAVDETRDTLEVEFEQPPSLYANEGTLNAEIATIHYVKVAMTTMESHDFIRLVIVAPAEGEMSHVVVQRAL